MASPGSGGTNAGYSAGPTAGSPPESNTGPGPGGPSPGAYGPGASSSGGCGGHPLPHLRVSVEDPALAVPLQEELGGGGSSGQSRQRPLRRCFKCGLTIQGMAGATFVDGLNLNDRNPRVGSRLVQAVPALVRHRHLSAPPPQPKRPPPRPQRRRPPPPTLKEEPPPYKPPPSGSCGEANSMKREQCNVCRGSQDDNRNVFQEGTHWICGVCGEENSVRRNACNSPYCKGVRLRDSVLTRYTPTEPGSSSSTGQEEGAPPKSSAGTEVGPPSGGPKPAYKPVYKVPPSQNKGDVDKKTKPPPFGVRRPSGQPSGMREEDKQHSGAGGNPPKASATPPRPKGRSRQFLHDRRRLRPRPTPRRRAMARSLSPRPLG